MNAARRTASAFACAFAFALPLALLLTAGCRVPLAGPTPGPSLGAHVADARRATTVAPASLRTAGEEARRIQEIRESWEQHLREPERLQDFVDFTTPQMLELREAARGEEAAARLGGPLTRDLVLAMAYERNPVLEAARRTLAARVEQYAQVTALNDVMRIYASFQRSSRDRLHPTLPMEGPAKHYPFPGTLELKSAVVRHAVEEAHAAYEERVADVITEVREVYARYEHHAQIIEITQRVLDYLEQLEETARARLSAATGGKANVLQTQVEISKTRNDLVTARRERDSQRARLAALLNVPVTTRFGEPEQEPLPPSPPAEEPLLQRAVEHQPRIAVQKARIHRMTTMIELAEKAAYPDLSPGLWEMEGISHETGGSDREREPFTTRPKGMPDPFFGTKEAYLREAREGVRAMEAKLQGVVNDTRYRVADARLDLLTALALVSLYRDQQIAQAEQAWRDAQAAYATERTQFLDVIDALRRYLGFQLDLAGAERDAFVAQARLEEAVGAPVPAPE